MNVHMNKIYLIYKAWYHFDLQITNLSSTFVRIYDVLPLYLLHFIRLYNYIRTSYVPILSFSLIPNPKAKLLLHTLSLSSIYFRVITKFKFSALFWSLLKLPLPFHAFLPIVQPSQISFLSIIYRFSEWKR